ncbi:MAG: DUF2382 domain-containing protein [Myxococcales bacterium]|nr:MAG: DUF2382 domain-containing protein [Myxococcales bacterium]
MDHLATRIDVTAWPVFGFSPHIIRIFTDGTPPAAWVGMANDSGPDHLSASTRVAQTNVIELERGPLVIPVVAEQLEIERRVVDRGRVVITKQVEERTEHVALDPLWHDDVDVERVAKGHFVEVTPVPRYEGDTLVLPVVEEVLVVEKRLRLREEVRITRRQTQVPAPAQDITLRAENVRIERVETPSTTGAIKDLHPVKPGRTGL